MLYLIDLLHFIHPGSPEYYRCFSAEKRNIQKCYCKRIWWHTYWSFCKFYACNKEKVVLCKPHILPSSRFLVHLQSVHLHKYNLCPHETHVDISLAFVLLVLWACCFAEDKRKELKRQTLCQVPQGRQRKGEEVKMSRCWRNMTLQYLHSSRSLYMELCQSLDGKLGFEERFIYASQYIISGTKGKTHFMHGQLSFVTELLYHVYLHYPAFLNYTFTLIVIFSATGLSQFPLKWVYLFLERLLQFEMCIHYEFLTYGIFLQLICFSFLLLPYKQWFGHLVQQCILSLCMYIYIYHIISNRES